ncbi:MAG: isoprenyl transferase [Armatimonadetes bacterium]|nr:isoprenyl transferase [Armatimonadota bacterium]
MKASRRAEPPPRLDPTRLPRHVAIIMDGNGRWARRRGLPRTEGHRAGREAVRRTLEACRDLSIEYLTLYAFSTENWRRPADEVEELLLLLHEFVAAEADDLERNGIRLHISGDLDHLPEAIAAKLREVMARTCGNTRLVLNCALNYGGRAELLQAVRRLAEDAAAGRVAPAAIDDATFARYLYTDGLPDPDLLIRTGGEQRISNFLLWQIAYTELYFSDVYWPDFDATHLAAAVEAFQGRRRRFGGVDVG